MRIARSLLAACVLAFAIAVALAAPAAASTPIAKKLGFTCPFPLIGLQKLDVEIKASFEVPSAPGGTFTTVDLAVAVTVPDKSTRGLALVGAASIEGTASAGVTLANGSLTLPLALPLTVAKTAVPASGPFTTNASGSVPPVQLPNAGKTTLTIGNFSTRLTPKKADGSATGLGSFTSDCTLDPGQDPVLLSFDLGGPAAHDYGVTGSTTLKALGATAPLSGAFAVPSFSPAFDRTRAEFKVFGFVPGTADLQFTPDGPQTGELGDGFVAHAKLALAVPQVTLFGLPVADAGCRASAPIPVDLRTGPGFALATGGPVTGTYAIPPLAGCGAFTAYLSSLVQGEGNTFALTLTAR
ncbi:hypothetical protein SAMN04489727_8048 [Amycolatopsis tolypomycina]|uniref:DUF6801 domain-containing protein n=1 Tax=Amycolatopsis tolypomycina TaxID=208445 RepID=A0A1H5B1E1_9PSEU|nr:DUF6801 domain-containing protein [Amycolatopsis tolypomycina]SED48235.1 hypothetical protein SAMN04489727_8048 [Amycolatopsis tolypomycina]